MAAGRRPATLILDQCYNALMMTIPYISLNLKWRVGDTELPSLRHWSWEQRPVWLRHTFDLQPAEACMRYILQIKDLPPRTRLYLNERDLGELAPPFQLDVTDFLTLEDNSIAFWIEAEGKFGDVSLRLVPCS
jgi:hypothetical protein